MKTKLIYLFITLIFTLNGVSQNIPVIKAGEKTIAVKKLKVDVTVIGDIAITTYDMHFYNPNNRVLEGELSFPLEENQSVIRFALGINGNLREAVVVEKEKARVAFETTVRNRIDPALLVKTKGNNYKARIYPIPAKGYKRVVLAFQQKLLINNEAYFYKIPFNYKEKLEYFSFDMKILNQKNKPVFTKGFKNSFKYDANDDTYSVKIESKRATIRKPVTIKIPLNTDKERVITNDEYFYYSKYINFKTKKNELENDITIFWDKSLSQKNKKIQTELNFLNEYFKKVQNCKVRLVVFNTEIRAENFYDIAYSNWCVLREKLENTIYDGASSFSFLNKYQDNSKLNLLFTDGLNTLSDLKVNLKKKTHIINSSVSANHNQLKNMVSTIGGNYINLQQTSISVAFNRIETNKIRFLGSNIPENLLEIYPKKGTIIQNNFSFSGKGNINTKNIKLFFGTNNDTLKTLSFSLKNNSKHQFISKIWVQKKLDFLAQNSNKNEEEIVELSKEYQVISDFTSMLILDRVEDYVTHKITPPNELKKQYDKLIARKINNKKERLANLQNEVFESYEDFFNWYDKDYKPIVKKEIVQNQVIDTSRITNEELRNSFTISGVVLDNNNPLPGVSIIIKDKNRGTETDFDGKYSINVKQDDILTFSYLGFKSKEVTINTQRNINIILEEDDNALDEIVVTGYARGTSTRRSLTGTVSVISSESINNALQGKVAGVNINNSLGQSGALTNINIRGAASVSNNSKPIYVVDGVVVSDTSQINSQDIKYSYVLDASQSTAIYGSRASSGVVVITTKKGEIMNKTQIDDFENLVSEKVELKGWNPKTPYLTILNSIKDTQKAYLKYIEIRKKYKNSPSFYIDVADFFRKRKDEKKAVQVLTNVAEIDLDNYELLRALAYKFEEYNLYKYAVYIYQEILKLRPEDIQSYRDLALAYGNVGNYQESLDLLYKIVNGELLLKDEDRRFSGIEIIALNEMNKLIALYGDKLQTNHINNKLIKNTKTDVRIVIDWNHNDTDIDLWIIDPNKEKCYYSHKETKIGGLISDDMTQGFGPEQFVLKNAVRGNYQIKVKYFANSKQKISGPTFLKITTFKNYGSKNESKITQLVRLTNTDDTLDLGKLMF